jgi:hypothetical protein
MYSSKLKLTREPEKFLVESAGVTFISSGGTESLGPPCGGTTFAQPGIKTIPSAMRRKARKTRLSFLILQT